MYSTDSGSIACLLNLGGVFENEPFFKIRREKVHGYVDQHRPGPAGLRKIEGTLHGARQVFHAVYPVDAFAEGPVDLALVGVLVQVHLLVWMTAVVVRRYVARNDDHRHGIKSRVRHAGGCVGQPRAKVAEHHSNLAGRARIAIGSVGRRLFVTCRDEFDRGILPQRIKYRDDRVATQTEDHFDT